MCAGFVIICDRVFGVEKKRKKVELSGILQCEEQRAAALPDLIHFLHRKWRRRISAHTAISSLILFLSATSPSPFASSP